MKRYGYIPELYNDFYQEIDNYLLVYAQLKKKNNL